MNRIRISSIALNKYNYHEGHYFMNFYYTAMNGQSYLMKKNAIDKVKHFSSDEKFPLVKDKYSF